MPSLTRLTRLLRPRAGAPQPAAAGGAERDGPGPVTRMLSAMATNRAFVDMMASISPSMDRAVHRLTRGRATTFSAVVPTLMLITTGSRTGQERRSPILYVRGEDGSLMVIGSNFGRASHPAWSGNLLKTPQATVVIRGRATAVTASLLSDAEREAAWTSLLRIWPAYAEYADRSGRELRIFRLVPVPDQGSRPSSAVA